MTHRHTARPRHAGGSYDGSRTRGAAGWLLASVLVTAGAVLTGMLAWAGSPVRPPADPGGVGAQAVPADALRAAPQAAPAQSLVRHPHTVFRRERPQPCTKTAPLLAMTFNIHHGARGARLDLEGIAREIEAVAPDVVALNEVDRHNRRSDDLDEAAWLGERLGMTAVMGVNKSWGGDSEYGNAILTKLPVLDQRNLLLPNAPRLEQRGLLLTTLDLEGITLTVGATHFQNGPVVPLRVPQARYVVSTLAGVESPRLLMGDLNDDHRSPALTILYQLLQDTWDQAGVGFGRTFPTDNPVGRIDYILGDDGIVAHDAGVNPSRVSDHRSAWAELTVTGPAMCQQPTLALARASSAKSR